MTSHFDKTRRYWLKQGVSAATLACVAASGLLLPKQVLAHWPREAFAAKTLEDALKALLGQAETIDDDSVSFTVGAPPTYAVNGATVPVEVNTTLKNIEHLALLVDKNPSPLAMSMTLHSAVMLPFKTLIKVAEDADIIAVIRAENQLYIAKRFVEIDIGGCA
ncbi:Sulfur oxidation protein SoxY [Methylophaga frappieri]|uniref:Sulfur oxidation protein SoxY n=1 Tax=Methylophaga frappieri (strain ATCC BAA-2434 / DSM 25690 / JAM7) TaxID=754477 RepID=I1YI19_METFJ|nr:thiosulfate oxidation carrier protein SoxY [Methylophaga frappieri]AFJ02562.1 Sulfur oxidation protein SoxY [Methylophaga frappieri]